MVYQRTIKTPIQLQGVGVHSGALSSIKMLPAEENAGITFVNDKNPVQCIQVGSVVPEAAMHATVIKANGWQVSTIEHLMAAIWVLGITNLTIVVTGTEVPILDGSALLFCHAFKKAGILEQGCLAAVIGPKRDIFIADDHGRSFLIQPSRDTLFIDYKADFKNPFIGDASLQVELSQEVFEQAIAPARTFGFLDQLPLLRQYNLARGTSLGNTVVIDGDLLNNMRLPAECVRHKVLDLVGDMALLGVGLAASVVAVKTGHGFNRLIVKHYKEHPEDWERVISSD